VTAELKKILEGDDAELAAAAAVSLGVPGNEVALSWLVGAANRGGDRVQMAAIRGLGRIATPTAQAALEEISEKHPKPAVRLRARGEVARLSKSGTRFENPRMVGDQDGVRLP
jgi:HEAT repeat protein